jgi:hypothetical protein
MASNNMYTKDHENPTSGSKLFMPIFPYKIVEVC